MNKIIINTDMSGVAISRHIYGHFAEHLGRCIYEGLWVGEGSPIPNTRGFRNDVVAALRELNIPNLRWPGGCFADTYHWNDGIGPREKRPSIVNVHWGGTTENNHCGTHEFLDLCSQLSSPTSLCEPYICGNVGSGTVREMSEWLEYLTMPNRSPMADLRRRNGREEPWHVSYWGVGNENWGCGGNMRAEYYADEYRRFQCFCRNLSKEKLYRVACGFDEPWNEVIMRECHQFMEGLSVHYYTIPGMSWTNKGSATDFTADDWFITMSKAAGVDGFLRRTSGIMDRYDPNRRIGLILDEWGTWFDVEPGTNPGFLYQQNTMRDAVLAGLSFNIFHAHSPRLHMTNIAQTVNVLQAMVLTEGPRMALTPTYHVFEMNKVHQGATLLSTHVETAEYDRPNPKPEGIGGVGATSGNVFSQKLPQVSASASRDANGKVHVSLCNLHPDAGIDLVCDIRGRAITGVSGRILTAGAMNAHNTFDQPDAVKPTVFNGFHRDGGMLRIDLPAKSVVVLEIA
jgi:alpha-N-arabinofuranosidase